MKNNFSKPIIATTDQMPSSIVKGTDLIRMLP
jgi:hypothetical protein